jgi:hypothetical protein
MTTVKCGATEKWDLYFSVLHFSVWRPICSRVIAPPPNAVIAAPSRASCRPSFSIADFKCRVSPHRRPKIIFLEERLGGRCQIQIITIISATAC